MDKIEILKAVLNDGGSASFATIVATVAQKMMPKKSGNPLFGKAITKQVRYHVSLNCNYTNVVNNQLAREGQTADFQAKENWHEKMFDGKNGSIVCKKSDKDCLYLMAIVNNAETLAYFIDGKPCDAEETELVKTWRMESSTPTNQGTNAPVIVRTIAFDNINEVRANGVKLAF